MKTDKVEQNVEVENVLENENVQPPVVMKLVGHADNSSEARLIKLIHQAIFE